MTIGFFSGLTLGFSIIIVIGAQNVFVLRQGLLGKHILPVVLFCSFSDALLIFIGISGASRFLTEVVQKYSTWIFLGVGIWLLFYAVIRFIDVYRGHGVEHYIEGPNNKLSTTLMSAAVLTFANPHVYLDTVILLGTISMKFEFLTRLAFGLGATTASFLFFFGLGYGASLMASRVQKPAVWKYINIGIGFIMLLVAVWMFQEAKIL
ncbi:MAG: lysine efflux permease [Rhodospirillaceae bacterium]|nr:lysine efflux permease [Rhodospirillaceae bacterium]OUU29105.1 MAG: hypothetical protein CBB97_03035 [Candidatus Endolissoclinum sp. TMED37]